MTKSDLTLRNDANRPLTYSEIDGNFNRLTYRHTLPWDLSRAPYTGYGEVEHNGRTYLAVVTSTSQEPGTGTDWILVGVPNAMEWKGVWTSQAYFKNQVVYHAGSIWIAVQDHTGVEPQPTNVPEWQLIIPSSGRGSMETTAPKAFADLGAGWVPLDNFDVIYLLTWGVSMNTTTGIFSFDFPGVWDITVGFNFTHNESNQGRVTNVRLFNVTDGTGGNPYPIAIARNQPGTDRSIRFAVDIGPTELGDEYRVELGGGDSITSVTMNLQDILALQFGSR